MLNALRPDSFIIVNNKSRKTINYFCGENLRQWIRDYRAVNETGHSLISSGAPIMAELSGSDASSADLFDMFCHWLVAERKYEPLLDRKIKVGKQEIPASVPEIEPQSSAVQTGTIEPRPSYKI